ncbi:MAG: metal-dependent hydrolase [Gammaproteobacteria bacterium]
MDILTHGLLGGSLAQSIARRRALPAAALAGFAGGILADVDILVRSAEDPLLNLAFHRALTHWLIFIPVGGLIAALLVWPLLRRALPFARIYLFTFLGYATHALLDAGTSYGTHLLGPFSDARIAWNVVSVVDPVVTVLLLGGFGLALWRRSPWPARVGLLLALSYFLLGWEQRQRATEQVEQLAAARGHVIERIEVKPTLGNIVLWRSIYQSDGHYHVAAVRVGRELQVYPGGSLPALDLTEAVPALPRDSVLYRDILRFEHFSDGYLVWHPEHSGIIGDLRYSMQPDGLSPLWGIEIDTDRPQRHAPLHHFRSMDSKLRQRFLQLLGGTE